MKGSSKVQTIHKCCSGRLQVVLHLPARSSRLLQSCAMPDPPFITPCKAQGMPCKVEEWLPSRSMHLSSKLGSILQYTVICFSLNSFVMQCFLAGRNLHAVTFTQY